MNPPVANGFLGGRLRLWQPAHGYRSGADAVMLAAACPARPGERVLELGCGAGVALFCLGARVPGLHLAGLELQPEYAGLARRNAQENGIEAQIHQGDLAQMPPALRQQAFDHVIANPPYFTAGTEAPDQGRGTARHESTALALWVRAGLRRLSPGGWLTVIQRIDRLGELLVALEGAAGGVTILPIAARAGRPAGRAIVIARKGGKAPLRLLAPFVMHEKAQHFEDAEDLTSAAQQVLREGRGIDLGLR